MSEETHQFFNRSESDKRYLEKRKQWLSTVEPENIADDFPLYTNRQELARQLVRYELIQKVLGIKGSIVECGTFRGAGLMMFANVCAMLEPYGFKRKIIGFDSFRGFPSVAQEDGNQAFPSELSISQKHYESLTTSIDLFDQNRPLSHIPKVELVEGDACETLPAYLLKNPHLVVSLLYLDFDLYEPTKVAIETLVPRMPAGSIIAFDELNDANRPGETLALLETIGFSELKLQQFPFEPHISYAVLKGKKLF